MILVVGLLAALVSVPLLGGSFRGIDRAELRGAPWISASVGAQVLLGGMPDTWVPRLVFTCSIPLAGVFVWLNRGRPGSRLLAWGGGCNLAAIASNGGVMPAWGWAWAASGAPALAPGRYANARPTADALLLPLGDVIPFPSGLPGSAPFSIGDVLLLAGFTVMIHHACATTWTVRRLRRAGAPSSELWRWRHLAEDAGTTVERGLDRRLLVVGAAGTTEAPIRDRGPGAPPGPRTPSPA